MPTDQLNPSLSPENPQESPSVRPSDLPDSLPIGPANLAPHEFQPVAAILAFCLPGLGHAWLGHYRRALLICVGILGLFTSGLLIGGIDAIDREEDYFWFIAQSLVGPLTFAADRIHQTHFKAYDHSTFNSVRTVADLRASQRRSARPDEFRVVGSRELLDQNSRRVAVTIPYFQHITTGSAGQYPPNIRGLGRANELGTLFCAVAGFVNLIAIVDICYHRRNRPALRPASRPAVSA